MTINKIKNGLATLGIILLVCIGYIMEAGEYVYDNYLIELKEPVINTFKIFSEIFLGVAKCVTYTLAIIWTLVFVRIKTFFNNFYIFINFLNNFLKKINKKLKKINENLKKSFEFRKEIIEECKEEDDLIPTVSSYSLAFYGKEAI